MHALDIYLTLTYTSLRERERIKDRSTSILGAIILIYLRTSPTLPLSPWGHCDTSGGQSGECPFPVQEKSRLLLLFLSPNQFWILLSCVLIAIWLVEHVRLQKTKIWWSGSVLSHQWTPDFSWHPASYRGWEESRVWIGNLLWLLSQQEKKKEKKEK